MDDLNLSVEELKLKDSFRQAVARFSTGVAVVSTGWGESLHGMTANAVCSLSLDPLQLLVCVRRESNCLAALERERAFCLNILREDQREVADYFAGRGGHSRYEFVSWKGLPRLRGVLAAIACDVDQLLDGGDHRIVIGTVRYCWQGPGQAPLLYSDGSYRRIGSPL